MFWGRAWPKHGQFNKRRALIKKKLTTDNKVKIVLSGDQSLRSLADEFNIHHSSAADIRKDAEKFLTDYFDKKSLAVGRPKAPVSEESEELKHLKAENERLQKAHVIASVKAEYAELKLKHERERNDEERRKKHLKKKRKKK